LFAVILLATSALTMSACASSGDQEKSTMEATSTSARGETLDAARERLAAMPGLAETSLEVDKTVSGLNTHKQLLVEATTSETDPAKVGGIVDRLVQLAWSVNDVRTDKGVSVRLHTSPQITIGDTVKSDWGKLIYRAEPEAFRAAVLFPRSTIEDRIGDWPGAVPDGQG
jgi:hypothetical protein